MRAGKLDRTITIQVWSEDGPPDEYGTPTEAWTDMATLRAQLVEASTEEFQRAFGASGETAIIFRTRFIDGVTLAHRVIYDGQTHNLVEIKEIGRRRGLELRTKRIGA